MTAEKNAASLLSSFSGEFRNPRMESCFRRAMQARDARQLRIALCAAGGLFLMIGLFDYLLLGLTTQFYLLALMRCVVAAAFFTLAAALVRQPRLVLRDLPLNSVIFLMATALIMIVPVRPETLNVQITATLAVTLAIFLFIPNRIPCALAACVYLGLGFIVAVYQTGLFERPGLVGIALTLIMANVVGMATALRLSHLQRIQFSSLLAERRSKRKLQKEIQTRENLEEELRRLAQTDHLTGLNNRRWFSELLKLEIKRSQRNATPLGLCMIDLDHFKKINDKLGHAAGDKVLSTVAAELRQALRETDIIGRFGGEEFVIALANSGPEETYSIAEHLRALIEQHCFSGELSTVRLTLTIGITQIETDSDTLESALARADRALYVGKRHGRNRVVSQTKGEEPMIFLLTNDRPLSAPSSC